MTDKDTARTEQQDLENAVPTPEVTKLDAPSEAIIRVGVKLGLNENSIRQGANALARLDNQTVPDASHVAEATQYLNPKYKVPEARQGRFDSFRGYSGS